METNYNQIVSLIWSIADDVLRDVFLRGQYRDVILPMVVLRRLDALLEPTKKEVEQELKENGAFVSRDESDTPEVIIEIRRANNEDRWYPVGKDGDGYSVKGKFEVFDNEKEAKKSDVYKALKKDGYSEKNGNLRFSNT